MPLPRLFSLSIALLFLLALQSVKAACPSNCASCQFSTCFSCSTTYYLTNSNKCRSCLANCDVCFDSATCSTCSTGYEYSQGECISQQASQSFSFYIYVGVGIGSAVVVGIFGFFLIRRLLKREDDDAADEPSVESAVRL
jgi:hypothetical protein